MIPNSVKQLCKGDVTKIENYEKALKDNTHQWVVHHRKEDELKVRAVYLIENNLYYHRPPEELIFLTSEEHSRHHATKDNHPLYGKSNPKKIKMSSFELFYFYCVKEYRLREIANIFNCSLATINIRMQKYGISKKKQLELKNMFRK